MQVAAGISGFRQVSWSFRKGSYSRMPAAVASGFRQVGRSWRQVEARSVDCRDFRN
jgi:hypothetical protein